MTKDNLPNWFSQAAVIGISSVFALALGTVITTVLANDAKSKEVNVEIRKEIVKAKKEVKLEIAEDIKEIKQEQKELLKEQQKMSIDIARILTLLEKE